ncbi:MAG: PAS domain S-box protein [Bacteroidia bacterium]|nr:PAS domain S-box protein [Bacteroidia bacterium]MDW8133594.1 PAS domain S-box protein [Bacteroidia bacterium]
MTKRVIIAWISAGLVLTGGLFIYHLIVKPAQEAREREIHAQLTALHRVWKGLSLQEPLLDSLVAPLRSISNSRAIEPLLNRLTEGIETEADRELLHAELERVENQLYAALYSHKEKARSQETLWYFTLSLLTIFLAGLGAFWLYNHYHQEALSTHLTHMLLKRWREGDWTVEVPPIPHADRMIGHLQTVWRATDKSLTCLLENRTDFDLPSDIDHPLLRKLSQLQSVIKARWDQESEQILTMQSLAAFSEILKESQTIPQLAERTIALLCKHLNAHMGALFVREGEDFVLVGTYAYDLSQLSQRRFRPSEGFVGQAGVEKRILRIHPVPSGYLKLRSGLGEATPHTLLLIPLIFQEEAYGVVELASLEAFSPAAEPFLQKIGEHIGAALANFISREKLRSLLLEEQGLRKVLEEKQAELLRSTQLMEEAQQKIIESQTQLASQIAAIRSAALVVEVDKEGYIHYANEAFLSAVGVSWSQLQGHSLPELVIEATIAEELKTALSRSEIWQGSLPLSTPTNSVIWLQATFAPLQGTKPTGFIGICFDITRQKVQEEELREMLEQTLAQEEKLREANQRLQSFSEELLRTQTELKGQIAAVGNAAIVSETDLQGRIIRVNELFLETYGYKAEEVLGQNHRILKSGHQSDEVFEEMWRTISQGKVWRGEVRNRTRDGRYYWILLTITPVLNPEGKVLKYIGVGFDITAQKRQEEELRAALELSQTQQRELRLYTQQLQAAQEEMRRTQVELRGQISAVHNAAIVAETDPEGRITFVNDTFCAISGYNREELLGQTHAILRSGYHDEGFYRHLWTTLSEKRVWKGIFCNRRKDGTLYWISSAITPVVDTRGRLVKYIAVSFDLTAQVEQEQRLREYAEELRRAQAELRGQIMAVGNAAYLMETDTAGNLLYANSAALEVWGYKWEEVEGRNLRFLNSGHHPPEFWAEMWRTLTQGQVWQGEVLNKTRSEELFWQLLTITPIRDPEGNIFKYIGVAFDITSQKRQAERIRLLLQESQEKEKALSAHAQQLEAIQTQLMQAQLELAGQISALNNAAIVSETDPEGRIIFVNDEATYIWGYTREELLGKPHSIIRSPNTPSRMFERMWDRIRSGFVWQGELENRAKDGSAFWVYLTITPVLDAEKKPYKYIGVAFDITRQKVQAQRLKEALHQLETQAGRLPHRLEVLPWFLTDCNGIIQAASPALLRMLSYSAETFIGQPARILRSSQTPDYIFLQLWATIGRGRPWQGLITNRDGKGVEQLYFLSIFPQEEYYLAVLLPAAEACENLKAEWLKNYAPLDALRDYEMILQAKDHEIYELKQIIQSLQSHFS